MTQSRSGRPNLQLPRTPFGIVLEVIAFLGLLALIGFSIWAVLALPARIPTHFNAAGQVNGYGSPMTLLLFPLVGLGLYILFAVLDRFPQVYNYPVRITAENAERQYQLVRMLLGWLKAWVVWLFVLILWLAVQGALQGNFSGLPFILFGVFGMVLPIVVYLVCALRAR